MREKQEPARGRTAPTLVVSYGSAKRKTRPLDRDLFVLGGSANADIHLVSPDIAAVHCLLARGEGGWMVRDCGSRLGTRLNGRLVHESPLGDGDVLQIGPFSFQLELPDDAGSTAARRAPAVPTLETPPPGSLPAALADAAEIGRLESRILHLQESRRRLAEHALRFRRHCRDQADADAARTRLQALQAELDSERERLREQHDALEARSLQLDQLEQELIRRQATFDQESTEYQRRQEEADAEIAAMRADAERRLALASRHEVRLAEREAELVAAAAAESALNEARAGELAAVQNRLQSAEDELTALRQKLAATEKQLADAPAATLAITGKGRAQALDQRQSELNHFAQHLHRLRESLEARERELASKLDSTERLHAHAPATEAAENDTRRQELEERAQQLSAKEQSLAEARVQLDRERAELENERAAVAQALAERAELDRQFSELAEKQSACRSLEQRLAAQAEELEAKDQQFAVRVAEHDQSASRIFEQQQTLIEQQRALDLRCREEAEVAETIAREQAALSEERARWAREREEHVTLLREKQEEIVRQQSELRQQRAAMIEELAMLREEKQASVGPDTEAAAAEIDELRRQVALRDSHIESLINEANTEIGRLEAVADHYRQQCEAIAAERDALASAAPAEPPIRPSDALSDDPATLKRTVAEREAAIQELRQELELYKRGLETSGGYEAEISRCRQELARDRKLLERDQSELLEQRAALDDAIREMELQMARERAQIARDRVELQRLRDEACMERERLERLAPIRERLASVHRFKSELLGKGDA